MPKNTLKVFWITTLITKRKTKIKIVKKEQFSFSKRNQGKQAFLGIFACLLGRQYDVHFLAEFKYLKNEKIINYLMRKPYMYDLATCKKESLHLDLSLKYDILYEISDLSNKTLRN